MNGALGTRQGVGLGVGLGVGFGVGLAPGGARARRRAYVQLKPRSHEAPAAVAAVRTFPLDRQCSSSPSSSSSSPPPPPRPLPSPRALPATPDLRSRSHPTSAILPRPRGLKLGGAPSEASEGLPRAVGAPLGTDRPLPRELLGALPQPLHPAVNLVDPLDDLAEDLRRVAHNPSEAILPKPPRPHRVSSWRRPEGHAISISFRGPPCKRPPRRITMAELGGFQNGQDV